MLPAPTHDLPIADVIDDLRLALDGSDNVVLVAPPGAGKTTVVPRALLDEEWWEGRKVVVLVPRGMAARAAGARLALGLEEDSGDSVG